MLNVPLVHLRGECHADADGQPVTERAGVHLHAGNVPRGMADIVRLIMADRFQVRRRKKSTIGKHSVECLDAMALALHITVARRAGERLWRDIEHTVVKDVQDVHAGQPAAGVARARADDEIEHRAAEREGLELKLMVGHGSKFPIIVWHCGSDFRATKMVQLSACHSHVQQ